jgi:type II secretory pathway pseudopilin PulG
LRSQSADERGYLMVALLVAMSVMAIMMSAAMPAWHTMVQREKEAELVFRGEQIARAIGLYQRRFANAPAPSIDFLVEQRFLRKKYKDPIANDDFQVLTSGTNQPGQVGRGAAPAQTTFGRAQGAAPVQTTAGRGGQSAAQSATFGRGGLQQTTLSFGGNATGGVIGVTSKSPLKSLRLYNGQDVYNQWVFMPVAQAARAGGPAGAGGRGADGRGAAPAGGGGFGRGQGGTPPGRGAAPQGQGGGPQGQGGRGGFQLPPPTRGRF